MKTKSLALSYLLSALFGLSIYGQIEDETIYGDDYTLGGDVAIKKKTIEVEGNLTYSTFEISVSEEGDYYLSAWLMATKTKDGYIPYEVLINGELTKNKIQPLINGWQYLEYWNENSDPITVVLNKGLNTVSFRAEAPEIPEIEFIRLSKDQNKTILSNNKYINYINSIRSYIKAQEGKPKVINDTSGLEFKSGVVLDNPLGNYYHHIGVISVH